MSVFEIISAIILIIACVFLVVVILMKDTKTQMSQTISGTSNDSFYQKNAGRTKDAMLNKATIAAAVIFFVLAVVVNLFNVYTSKKASAEDISESTSIAASSDVSDVSESTADTSAEESSGTGSAESESAAESNSEGTSAESEAATSAASESSTGSAESSAESETNAE